MNNDSKLEESLQDIGLTLYEARVFIGLSKLGPAIATEISNVSGVPRSKIYATIDKLKEKGLVTVEDSGGSKKFYKTIGVKQGILRLKEDILNSVENSANYATKTLSDVQGSLQKKVTPDQELWTLKGLDKITQVTIEMIEKSQEQIIISFIPELILPIQEALEEAKSQKRSIQLLLPAHHFQEVSETVSLDKITTQVASFNLDSLTNFLEMLPSEIAPINSANIAQLLTVILRNLPNILTIDPDTENYSSLLILRSEDPDIGTVAIQFINKDFVSFQTRLIRLVWDLMGQLGEITEF